VLDVGLHARDAPARPCEPRHLGDDLFWRRDGHQQQPGDHSLRFAGSGDSEALFGAIADFLCGTLQPPAPARVLATTLVATAAPSGSAGPLVRDHSGRLVSATEQGILATFGTPGQAINCARNPGGGCVGRAAGELRDPHR
jgi:hypothetical protein